MIKQIILLIILSILVAMTLQHLTVIYTLLHFTAVEFSRLSNTIFASPHIAKIVANTAFLVIIPFVIGWIIGGIYFLLTRKSSSYSSHLIWTCWIILATALVAMTKIY